MKNISYDLRESEIQVCFCFPNLGVFINVSDLNNKDKAELYKCLRKAEDILKKYGTK